MNTHILIYLGIGASIMAFVVLRTPYDNEPDVMVKLMARVDYSDTSNLYENILIRFLVPLSACLITVVAWPWLLIGKAWDSWEFRHIRRQEKIARSSKSASPEAQLVQQVVKEMEVSDAEWAAAKVQKLLAMTQSESKVSDV